MKVFVLMVENQLTGKKHCDSVWETKDDVENYIKQINDVLDEFECKAHIIERTLFKHMG